MWDPTGHHPCGGRVRHAVKGVRGNWIEVMGGQDNATSADEADIAMNVQGLHGEPRETRGTTIGNTGNYEKKGQNGNEENGHNGNKENGHGKATKAKEMLLSLIKKLPADQRRMLSGKLRAMEADTTIDQGRKAEIAGAFISKLRAEARASDEASYTKAAEPLEEEMPENTDVGEEAKANKVDEVEANATQVKEPSEAPAAPGEPREEPRTAHEKLRLLIKRLTVDQRNALSVQLRVLEQDTSISQGRKAEIARGIIAKAAEPQEEQRGILEEQTHPEEEMPESAGIVDDAQGGGLLDSTENQPGRVGSGVSEVDIELEEPVIELEEPVILGKIEIGVDVGEPEVVNEHLKVSDTGRSIEEDPVVGGLSEVSVVTIKEIIAGDDVKAKDIGKSVDFPVGGVIRDDSIVSIMSMDYEGCCLQEESMEIQCQERGVVDYDYDDGDTIRAKFKYGRPAFAPGGIGMFVVTGRPPGRLIGG